MDELQLLKEVLSYLGVAHWGEKLVPIGVTWFFVKRTVKSEFGTINGTLKLLTGSVNELKLALTTLESGHSERLKTLETEVRELKTVKVVLDDQSIRRTGLVEAT